MAKSYAKKTKKKDPHDLSDQLMQNLPADLPDEARQRLARIKDHLVSFKERLLKKFDTYIAGVALLPPEKGKEQDEQVNALVLVDDTEQQEMAPDELQRKMEEAVKKEAEAIDKRLQVQTILLSDVWQSCYDAKYDLLEMIAVAAPIYDRGMLAAIKISEVHKSMVLKKFEKYIVCYVLAGSLVQGRATHKSDIDVFIVIDDTDVKRMTRAELKDKLRSIIIGMGIDAGKLTGIENKINIQVYILTDFWDFIKEANPIIFTFLRDGVPFYDRGIFMPWKQLLRMGKVKPSPEAIDIFMQTGSQMMERIRFKMREMAMEDTFYATLTPSQAALMLYGVPPPTPKETPQVLRETFVKKEKMLEDSYVKMLEKQIKMRKDLEHGDRKEVSGKELDELITNADKYLLRLKDLFASIEQLRDKQSVRHAYENTVTVIRDILRFEGVERVADADMIRHFEREVIHKGLIPEKYLRILKDIVKAKKDYDANRLTKTEVQKVVKHSQELLKFMVEYLQRKRGRELEKARIRVKHGKRFGEVILLEDEAFIIHDIDNEQKEISRAKLRENGSIAEVKQSSLEELEKVLASVRLPAHVFIKEPIFEDLKNIFGRDVEILLNN